VKELNLGWISAVHPSRRLLRNLLRMRGFLNAINKAPHGEERRGRVSNHARRRCKILFPARRLLLHTLEGGGPEPASGSNRGQTTEISGFPLARERRNKHHRTKNSKFLTARGARAQFQMKRSHRTVMPPPAGPRTGSCAKADRFGHCDNRRPIFAASCSTSTRFARPDPRLSG